MTAENGIDQDSYFLGAFASAASALRTVVNGVHGDSFTKQDIVDIAGIQLKVVVDSMVRRNMDIGAIVAQLHLDDLITVADLSEPGEDKLAAVFVGDEPDASSIADLLRGFPL